MSIKSLTKYQELVDDSGLSTASSNNTDVIKNWVIIALALLSTVLLAVFASRLENTFLNHYPRFYDALSYDSQLANIYLDQKAHGQLAALGNELRNNNRDIFRTIPLLMFAPDLLSKQYGQFATSLPLLFAFGALLATECYRIHKSMLLSILCLASVYCVPGLMHPVNGYAANWLDMPAAMAMGIAVIALLRFVKTYHLKWLCIFGIFASLTATSRWSAAPYLAFYGAPVLLLGLFRYVRHHSGRKRQLILASLAMTPGILFVLYHIPSTYWYYSKVCFGMGSTISDAFTCTTQGVEMLLGTSLLMIIFLLTAANVSRSMFSGITSEKVLTLICTIWFPISLFSFLVFILKSSQAIHPMVYLVPALLISAFGMDLGTRPVKSYVMGAFSLIAMLFLAQQTFLNYHYLNILAKHPSPDVIAAKKLDLTLARFMGDHKIRTYSEYDDERSMATMDCFYQSRWKPNYRERSFSIHEPYFKAWYPGKNPLEVARQIFEDNVKDVDLVLIHENNADISNNLGMRNPYSLAVSSYMTEKVPRSARWKKVSVWQGPYGPMAVYVNRSFEP